jgi:hypothetical protein
MCYLVPHWSKVFSVNSPRPIQLNTLVDSSDLNVQKLPNQAVSDSRNMGRATKCYALKYEFMARLVRLPHATAMPIRTLNHCSRTPQRLLVAISRCFFTI